MTEICSKMVSGLSKEARKATCLPRMPSAPSTKRLGKPSGNFFQEMSARRMSRFVDAFAMACARSFIWGQ